MKKFLSIIVALMLIAATVSPANAWRGRYYGRGYYPGYGVNGNAGAALGLGIGLGLLGGAIASQQYYNNNYYYNGYYGYPYNYYPAVPVYPGW